MEQQQVYSNAVNVIGDAEVSLWLAWHDTVLIGVAEHHGVVEKRWLQQGEFIEIDGRRWVMLDLQHAVESSESALMVQLVAVE